MKDIIDFIKNNKIGDYKENALMSTYTTYKVGGKAKILVFPKDVEKLILFLVVLLKK